MVYKNIIMQCTGHYSKEYNLLRERDGGERERREREGEGERGAAQFSE